MSNETNESPRLGQPGIFASLPPIPVPSGYRLVSEKVGESEGRTGKQRLEVDCIGGPIQLSYNERGIAFLDQFAHAITWYDWNPGSDPHRDNNHPAAPLPLGPGQPPQKFNAVVINRGDQGSRFVGFSFYRIGFVPNSFKF